ncbi:MAG: glycosyltransferase family 2 protein [Candidatus Nanopelagicales bacterium]
MSANQTSAAEEASSGCWPDGISVIMPVLDEERHLGEAVAGILEQEWSGALEVILALGPSRDRTDEVARDLQARDSRVVIVSNPTGKTPAALNAAIAVSRYQVVVRVDGHAVLSPGYLRLAVQTLRRTGADNVGGVMSAVGTTPFEQAVAAAMTSKLGVGAAAFHVGGGEGPAETVYLGSFRRDALERVGGYDETFLRAQDWEMNHRILHSGGEVWFNPELVVTYRPRPDLKSLAKQYFHYGRWRREVMRAHPETVSGASAARYLAPPVTLVLVAGGTLKGLIGTLGGPRLMRLGWLAPAGYFGLIAAGSLVIGRGLPLTARAALPVVLATMHGSWGAGFLCSPDDLRTDRGQGANLAGPAHQAGR